MSTSAVITMVTTQVSVTLIMLYFFRKVLKTPPKSE